MEYYLNQFGSMFSSTKDFGTDLFTGSGITVQAYHLKKHTRLMEHFDTEVLVNGNHTIVYLLMSGQLEFRFDDERVLLEAGQSIALQMDNNFSAWALEDSNFFSIHNCVEPDVDNTPAELVEALKQVELKDAYLRGHNYRVGKYSTLLMQAIDPERSTVKFNFVSAYHDVGKVVVPGEILNKNGRLTPEEFAEIKKHPVSSYDMLKPFVGKRAAGFARWHHEKLDGSGYPDGLTGDEIPLESRVMAVADIFDALTTSRCYRGAFTFDQALDIMRKDAAAGKLDSAVFDALEHMVFTGVLREGVDNILMGSEPDL